MSGAFRELLQVLERPGPGAATESGDPSGDVVDETCLAHLPIGDDVDPGTSLPGNGVCDRVGGRESGQAPGLYEAADRLAVIPGDHVGDSRTDVQVAAWWQPVDLRVRAVQVGDQPLAVGKLAEDTEVGFARGLQGVSPALCAAAAVCWMKSK